MGRRKYIDPQLFTRVNKLRLEGNTYRHIDTLTGVPYSTCWRWCNNDREERVRTHGEVD